MKVFLAAVLFTAVAALRFDGDQVLTLFPQTPEQLRMIKEIGDVAGLVDFWKPDSAELVCIGQAVDIRVPRHFLKTIKAKLGLVNLHHETKIENVQQLVDGQFDVKAKSPRNSGYDYNVYHTYDEIVQWTNDMVNEYPALAQRAILTTSTEGRDVPYLVLGSSIDNPLFVIDCGIHAREWIAPAFCQYFTHRMLSQYGVDSVVTNMMDKMTWVIIPILNVDGYSYSWTDDRMWRKTRSNYGTVCSGVDANRNYDINWSGEGASTNPCSDTYCGPSVESEPVIKASSDHLRQHAAVTKAYIAFHSYSQVFVYPYSYAYEDTANADQLFTLSENASRVIYETTGKSYDWGPGYQSMYLVSGGSKDFAYNLGIPLSWTIELRDTGKFGFILPESEIAGNCEEMFQAMIVITDEAIRTPK